MAREIRKIIFSEQDLLEAMLNYATRNDYVLPRARIERLAVRKDAHEGLSVKFLWNDPTLTTNISFNEGEIAAALILFCKNQKIPLAKSAKKSIVQHEDSIAFQLSIDWANKKEL